MLCRFKQQSEGASEQLDVVQQGDADAGAAKALVPANALLGIVSSQRDRFRSRCAAPPCQSLACRDEACACHHRRILLTSRYLGP